MAKKGGSTVNAKVQAAKARKQLQKEMEKAKQEKQKEDAKWVDDDPKRKKAEQRRLERQRKAEEAKQRKAENRAILEEEEREIEESVHKAKGKNKPDNIKKTRAQLEMLKLKREREAKKRAKEHEQAKKKLTVQQIEEENPNKVYAEYTASNDIKEARTVEEAIQVLRISGADALPTKQKMTYDEFEAEQLEHFKADNPSLRLSQVKTKVRKAWQRSPMNPANQA